MGKEEDLGIYRLCCLPQVLVQLQSELSRSLKEKQQVGNIYHGFTKGKLGSLHIFLSLTERASAGLLSLMELGNTTLKKHP